MTAATDPQATPQSYADRLAPPTPSPSFVLIGSPVDPTTSATPNDVLMATANDDLADIAFTDAATTDTADDDTTRSVLDAFSNSALAPSMAAATPEPEPAVAVPAEFDVLDLSDAADNSAPALPATPIVAIEPAAEVATPGDVADRLAEIAELHADVRAQIEREAPRSYSAELGEALAGLAEATELADELGGTNPDDIAELLELNMRTVDSYESLNSTRVSWEREGGAALLRQDQSLAAERDSLERRVVAWIDELLAIVPAYDAVDHEHTKAVVSALTSGTSRLDRALAEARLALLDAHSLEAGAFLADARNESVVRDLAMLVGTIADTDTRGPVACEWFDELDDASMRRVIAAAPSGRDASTSIAA